MEEEKRGLIALVVAFALNKAFRSLPRAGKERLLAQPLPAPSKGTPTAAVLRASMPSDFASLLRGSLMGHPWPVNELRTSCAHPLRGLILRNLAATDGAPGKAGGFLPPEATATATTRQRQRPKRGISTKPSYRRRPVSSF